MKPDPNDQKKLWKKSICLQEVAPRSYEVDIEGKRYRRNRTNLIAIRESPTIDSHVGEPDEPPLSDDQSQRIVDPVQPDTPLPEDSQLQNDQRPLMIKKPPEIPQPTERRSTKGYLIRSPICFKDYCHP